MGCWMVAQINNWWPIGTEDMTGGSQPMALQDRKNVIRFKVWWLKWQLYFGNFYDADEEQKLKQSLYQMQRCLKRLQ